MFYCSSNEQGEAGILVKPHYMWRIIKPKSAWSLFIHSMIKTRWGETSDIGFLWLMKLNKQRRRKYLDEELRLGRMSSDDHLRGHMCV